MNYTKDQQETLLQTIKARLERNERNERDEIIAIPDENGPWNIVSNVNSGLIKYFEPAHKINVDVYGNYSDNNSTL